METTFENLEPGDFFIGSFRPFFTSTADTPTLYMKLKTDPTKVPRQPNCVDCKGQTWTMLNEKTVVIYLGRLRLMP